MGSGGKWIWESGSNQACQGDLYGTLAAAKNLVDSDCRDYYQAAVLTMITINRDSNRVRATARGALNAADVGTSTRLRPRQPRRSTR
jgi:hypothetical protein